MLIVEQEHYDPVEIDAGSGLHTVVFLENGEHLMSGSEAGVRVWRVKDGKELATMEASQVNSVAVSNDGSRIAAGTEDGEVFVWNAETYEQVFWCNLDRENLHSGVDLSPDATRLVSASSNSIWDIATGERVLLLDHDDGHCIAAKYSPQGDQIATLTAARDRVRVYDSNDGHLLVDIKVKVAASSNHGLLWLNNHLLVVSDSKIKEFDTSTGSVVSEWPDPESESFSCITLPKHGKLIAYSTRRAVTFQDTSTHTQHNPIQYAQDLSSIALSPDARFLAIGGKGGKIIIESLSHIKAPTCEHGQHDKQPSTSGGHEGGSSHSQRSSEELAHLGDIAAHAQRHDEAISHYTTALSLDTPSPQSILVKRSKAFLETGSWKQALDDADEVIRLDPSSPWGYEVKHAALHKARKYEDAINAFEAMLSKMAQSPDPDIQQRGDQYISPSTTRTVIRRIVQRTIRRSPRVLINTKTGRLHDRTERAAAFESLPILHELVSSMTTHINYVRIKREVRQYFRYVMLSHKLETDEPLFEQVIHIAVYDLEKSPTHDKLQTFCKIVRDGGFNWAWSYTCCIHQSDHSDLQETLVAMIKWIQGCALMIVFLRAVPSSSLVGALARSIWNTRAWALQEYIAAKVVQFYTEDWTPYLNLQLANHKESREVISEMERETGVSADQLMSLRPGLTSIREKLRLASTRQTTLVEDAAYSLLGIFSVTDLPIIYGEGKDSLSRVLAHVLTQSGDASILAWAGESGSFNSCLPSHITVFHGSATSHLPQTITNAEIERIITSSPFDLDGALALYDRLNDLPAPCVGVLFIMQTRLLLGR
ncbi:WD40-repeat-containing domain protein [Boletus reticuloceps]|uniref:WD40-repeat-containing domain protein n=1 Tax=Boletus reticuloceps TaxID=495285 RepID=A0A8I3AAD3_9AGAM|nr:WD40-repeat-containing domain protein [Boletus reticuloceps]